MLGSRKCLLLSINMDRVIPWGPLHQRQTYRIASTTIYHFLAQYDAQYHLEGEGSELGNHSLVSVVSVTS